MFRSIPFQRIAGWSRAATFPLATILVVAILYFLLKKLPIVWWWVVWCFRLRYSLLGAASPILVIVLCLAIAPSKLKGMLVLRDMPQDGWGSWFGSKVRGRVLNQYFLDLFHITWQSLLVCFFACVTARVTIEHADLRFGKVSDLYPQFTQPVISMENTASEESLGWYYPLALALASAVGLVLPIFAVFRSIFERVPTRLTWRPRQVDRFDLIQNAKNQSVPTFQAWITSLVAIACGILFYVVLLITLGFLQFHLIGSYAGASGSKSSKFWLNPGELVWNRSKQLDAPELPSYRQQTPLQGFVEDRVKNLLDWFPGRGYLVIDRETNEVRPGSGHSFLLLLGLVSTMAHVGWHLYGKFRFAWKTPAWSGLFYLLVAAYLLVWVLPGVAFFFDGFGFPPIIALACGIIGFAKWAKYDHYFETNAKKRTKRKAYRPFRSRPVWPNALMEAIESRSDPSDADCVPIPFKEIARRRMDQIPGPKEDKTLVIVAAAGGGIQSAVWTAKTLGRLSTEIPGFQESIGLISGVSGGSVGGLQFVSHCGHRGDSRFSTDQRRRLLGRACKKACSASATSSLESVAWGLLFPDLLRLFFPFANNRYYDRGWAIEQEWQATLGPTRECNDRIQDVRMSDLQRLVNRASVPAMVFNATSVETGQRVLISTLADPEGEKGNLANETTRLVQFPIHFHEFYGRSSPNEMRVTTAARLSATFAYVTPVAKPYMHEIANRETLPAFELHICDGGYSDNGGITTAVKWIRELLKDPSDLPFKKIALVQIDGFPPTQSDFTKENEGIWSAIAGPSVALDAARISTQAERSKLETDMLEELYPKIVKKFLFQYESNEAPPLTWALTPNDIRSIERAWPSTGKASQVCKRDSTGACSECIATPARSTTPTQQAECLKKFMSKEFD